MAKKSVEKKISVAIFSLVVFVFGPLLCTVGMDLEFDRYQFRKKSNWGRAVNRADFVCREEVCQNAESGLLKDICIRKCISPHCYEELYAWNELEEGERDIRWTSFKGCAADELRKKEQARFDL